MNRKLYEARTRNRWTIEKVCDLTGISEKTYRRWEKGTHQPHYSSLELLCAAFNLTAEELGFSEESPTETKALLIPPSATSINSLTVTDDLFATGVMALLLAQQANRWTLEELRTRVDYEMRQYDMGNNDLTRREALKFLSSLPLAFTSFSTVTNAITSDEMLALFTAGIPACWKLYYTGGNLYEIQKTIQTYINHLEPIAIQASKYQQSASGLISQSYQLASMLSLEYEDYNTAMSQASNAINYAQTAFDPNIEAASIIRKATVLYYQRRYRQMSSVIQSATRLIKQVSPLMRSRIYSELATDAYAPSAQDTLRYVGMAIDSCPDDVEADPTYNYTHTSRYILHFNEEIAYANLGQYDNALQALHHAEKHVPDATSTRKMELITHQAASAIALQDLDLSCEKVTQAITISNILQSDLWFSDVERLCSQLQAQWKHEKRVQIIGESLRVR